MSFSFPFLPLPSLPFPSLPFPSPPFPSLPFPSQMSDVQWRAKCKQCKHLDHRLFGILPQYVAKEFMGEELDSVSTAGDAYEQVDVSCEKDKIVSVHVDTLDMTITEKKECSSDKVPNIIANTHTSDDWTRKLKFGFSTLRCPII